MKMATPHRHRLNTRAALFGLRSLRATTLTAVVGFSVLLSLPSKADSAFLLEIDSDDSWITQNCLSTCALGPFSIAGRFELQVWDQDLGFGNIDLVDVSVDELLETLLR